MSVKRPNRANRASHVCVSWLAHYGRLFGIHLGLITAGSMLAPLLFAAMYKASGSYVPLLVYCATCCVIGPLLLLTLGRMPARASAT